MKKLNRTGGLLSHLATVLLCALLMSVYLPVSGLGMADGRAYANNDPDYEREWDRSMFPDEWGSVRSYYSVFVYYDELGDWAEDFYDVKNVQIIEQRNPEGEDVGSNDNDGDDVIELRAWEDNDARGWDYHSRNSGDARLEVTYTNLDGLDDTYTFNIHVANDIYEIRPVTETGGSKAFPGSEVEMFLFLTHRHREWIANPGQENGGEWRDTEDENTEGMTIEWRVEDDDSEPADKASIAVNPADNRKAKLETGNFSDGNEEKTIRIIASLKDGDDIVAENDYWIVIRDFYFELWPNYLDEEVTDMDVGDTKEVIAEVRRYDKDKISANNPEGYTIIPAKFTWGYDSDRVSITDAEGNEVNEVNDETVSDNSKKFYIKRLREEWRGEYEEEEPPRLMLHANWQVLEGDELWEYREYELDRKIYNLSLEDKDENGQDSCWNIFPDQNVIVTPTLDGNALEDSGDYRAVITLGSFSGENDRFVPFEGTGFFTEQDNYAIKIKGEKLYKDKGVGQVAVRVELYKGDNKLAERYRWLDICDNKEELEIESKKNVLPGWRIDINSRYNYWVKNRYYPDEKCLTAIVTGAEIIEGQDKVEECERGTDDNGGKWYYYEAREMGSAKIRVTYDVVDGEWNEDEERFVVKEEIARGKTHEMTVYVVDAFYEAYVDSTTGSNRSTENGRITLKADVTRYTKDGNENNPEGLTYEWSMEAMSDEAQGAASIAPVGDDPSAAVVNFGTLPEGWDSENFKAKVSVKKGDEEVASDWRELELRKEYYEIEPLRIEDLDPGQETTVTVALKHYTGTGGGDIVHDVGFRWEYDEDAIEISEGKDNGDGSYDFTIKRNTTAWTDFRLIAEWDDWREEEAWYGFGECNYGVWFADDDFWDVYTDGDKSLTVDLDDFGGYEGMTEKGYTLRFRVGVWGDEDWDNEFTEGNEFSSDKNKVTLHGNELIEYLDGNVKVVAEVLRGDEVLWDDRRDVHVRDVRADYDLPWDRGMLPGWDEWIDSNRNVWVENSEYPWGEDFEFTITKVEVAEQHTADGLQGAEVVRIDQQDDGWRIEAVNHGEASIKVTYTDINDEPQEHFFNLYVGSDVYGVDVSTDDGKNRARPGDTVTLIADAWHESEEDPSTKGITYDWRADDFNAEWGELATLTPNGNKAVLKFKDYDEMPEYIQDGEWENLRVEVIIYDGEDEDHNPIERARGDINIDLANSFLEIAPYTNNRRLAVGETEAFKAELRVYPGKNDKYDLRDAHFRWYYNEDAIEITDSEGNVVGNNNEDGEYRDSEASYGEQAVFHIKRLRHSNERFEVKVDARNGDGDWQETEMREYWLDELDYNIEFDEDHKDVNCESGRKVAFKLNKSEELKAAGDNLTVVYEVGEWDGDNDKWSKRLTVLDEEYELTQNGLKINKDKALAREIHDVGIRAVLKQGDEELFDRWAWLHIDDHDWDGGHKTKDPTCTENGETTYTCNICQDDRVEANIPALGHDWNEWTQTKAPTCAEKGTETRTCKHDATHTETREIDVLEHTEEVIPAVAATCTTAGKTAGKKCSVCGEILEAPQEIAALGHDWNEWTQTAPTCTEKGTETRTCKHDAAHSETREIDALGHSEEVIPAVAATCTTAGKTAGKKCSVCGEILEAQKDIPALGHDYKDVKGSAKAATCTAAGKKADQECTRCHDIKTGAKIAALGHAWTKVTYKWSKDYTKCTATRTCTHNSKHKETETVKTKAKVTKKATKKVKGKSKYTATFKNKAFANQSKTLKTAFNPITAVPKVKTNVVAYNAVKSKNLTIAAKKAFVVTKAQGAVSYKKASGNAKIVVSKTGKITIKKGIKKGTYKVEVQVTAAGNKSYQPRTAKVKLTIKVK